MMQGVEGPKLSTTRLCSGGSYRQRTREGNGDLVTSAFCGC